MEYYVFDERKLKNEKKKKKTKNLFLPKKFTDSFPENSFGSQDRVIRSWLKGYKI